MSADQDHDARTFLREFRRLFARFAAQEERLEFLVAQAVYINWVMSLPERKERS